MTARDLLARLVGFPTVSRNSNLDLIAFIGAYLAEHGVKAELVHNADGSKASLYALVGPAHVPGGVLFSGHTDIVPTDGQVWQSDPFVLEERDGKLFGRGTADMKGFIASVLAAVPPMTRAKLTKPIHLAFSYDEEVGCLGVRPMLDILQQRGLAPDICIIGEPTEMSVATAHKGKTAATCTCRGVSAHSALAPTGLNALYLATDMIGAIRTLQERLARDGDRDAAYSVPYTTVHVGVLTGGTALNIVPGDSRFDFEIRNLPGDDPESLIGQLRDAAVDLIAQHHDRFPDADIDIAVFNSYPALDTAATHPMVEMVRQLAAAGNITKVAYGTEGGLFQQALNVPVVVCGPGSMAQGHRPDEYIEVSQLDACDAFITRLIARLSA